MEKSRSSIIQDLIASLSKKVDGITEEQEKLAYDLYIDDDRNLKEIKQELLSYFSSISQINAGLPMKNQASKLSFGLDVNSKYKGIYLGRTQIDLMMITEVKSFAQLQAFINECEQIDYSEIYLQELRKKSLETAKKQVFEDYRSTLIGTSDLKRDPTIILRKKLTRLGLTYDDIEKVIALYQSKNIEKTAHYIIENSQFNLEEIVQKNFKINVFDNDDVKCSSYEEMASLAQRLKEFDRVIITIGEYSSVMCNGKFNPYHIRRSLDFCKNHNIHARYHSLLSQETLNNFPETNKEEIKAKLHQYILESINYINAYNAENNLEDGMPLINAIDIFDELINLKKDKSSSVGYYNIWENKGLTIEDLVDILSPAIENKDPKIAYIYNETFVETPEKRRIQLNLATQIQNLAPTLIDTFGTKMHISTEHKTKTIENTLSDLKRFSDETGIKLAITEFAMYVPEKTLNYLTSLGLTKKETTNIATLIKQTKLATISEIAKKLAIDFDEISYWSATDSMDHDKKSQGANTLYGGLFGRSLEPKGVEEVIDYTPKLIRPEEVTNVLGYLNTLNNMLETQPIIMPKKYDAPQASPGKTLVKNTNKIQPQTNQDENGFANFPQLLITSLILIGILYILLM